MGHLVKGALEYIQTAISRAGEALLAKVQTMTPEERLTLPKGFMFPFPTDKDPMNGQYRQKRFGSSYLFEASR
jgi:hypothetical protein